MRYAIKDEEGQGVVKAGDVAHQEALESYDTSELGRAAVGDMQAIKSMMDSACKGPEEQRKVIITAIFCCFPPHYSFTIVDRRAS
jgi:hypothetical protein